MSAEQKTGRAVGERVSVEIHDTGLVLAITGEPAAVAALIEHLRRRPGPVRQARDTGPEPGPACLSALTVQETAIAMLVGRALTNQQIARRMGISAHTVNYHLRQIFRKLEIRSRVHLATLARTGSEGHDDV